MDITHSTASLRNDELLKGPHPFLSSFEQTVFRRGLPADARTGSAPACNDEALEKALLQFKTELLVPTELPAIYQSFLSARENDFRAICKLDAELRTRTADPEFARASQTIGRARLKQLRPLKDHRLTRKYLAAMETGTIHGWHIIVYGISLEIYSIPVRQGLINYADRTLSALIERGTKGVVSATSSQRLLSRIIEDVPAVIDALLPKFTPNDISAV